MRGPRSAKALLADDVLEEVTRLKQQPGGDIALFGSAGLAASLARHGLIDEYRVLVTPVILGTGNVMFKDIWLRTRLRLLKSEAWSSGTVALFYAPAPAAA